MCAMADKRPYYITTAIDYGNADKPDLVILHGMRRLRRTRWRAFGACKAGMCSF